jgi:hypothetical protein
MIYGRPDALMTGITLAKRRSFGLLPSLYLLAKPYNEIRRISWHPKRIIADENLWDSIKATGTSHLDCLDGSVVKMAEPTASPRYEGLQSTVDFLGATGGLQ